MQVKTRPNEWRTARVRRPPAPWVWWQHGGALGVLAALALAFFVAPIDYAAAFGTHALAGQNAIWPRLILMFAPALLAVGRRGQPWPHTLICLLLSAGYSGQVARMLYSDDVLPLPWALLLISLGLLGYLALLALRPTVHEQLQTERAYAAQCEALLRLNGITPPRGGR